MIVAAAVDGAPYDIASRIDAKATERLCGSRYINSGKCSIAEEKTVAPSRFLFRQQFLKTWIVADRMKGKLKQKYGQLMDNDLSLAEGK
jgi:hypothetical protein